MDKVELTQQEHSLLEELINKELRCLSMIDWPGDSAKRLEWRCGKLEDIRAKLHIAKGGS